MDWPPVYGRQGLGRLGPAVPMLASARTTAVDEYQQELDEISRSLEDLRLSGRDPDLQEELEGQRLVLSAIYRAARQLYQAGRDDLDLGLALAARGFGAWTLDDVYAFVYEEALDLDASGPGEFAAAIDRCDFRMRLPSAPMEAG